jgi:hypothetical protein
MDERKRTAAACPVPLPGETPAPPFRIDARNAGIAMAGKGGTFKDGVIELQGDQVAPALAALEKEGFRPKQAGGG